MRHLLALSVLAGLACGQNMTDVAAAATGGVAGGVAGKKVSQGLTSVFGKVTKEVERASSDVAPRKTTSAPSAGSVAPGNAPLMEVGPGIPKKASAPEKPRISGGVPLPPPPVRRAAATEPPARPMPVEPVVVPPPTFQVKPPQVTQEDLQQLAQGTAREDVLRLGSPAYRVTMFDDGHLMELFRYASRDVMIGHVRLTDGKVTSIDLK